MKKLAVNLTIFLIGGLSYGLLEIIWRQYTHWSMVITGGVCFLLMYHIYSAHPNMNLLLRGAVGALVITVIEFICGCIVNLWLDLGVWDYSRFHIHLLGQVCLLYSVLWGLLSIPVSALCIKIKGTVDRLDQRKHVQA